MTQGLEETGARLRSGEVSVTQLAQGALEAAGGLEDLNAFISLGVEEEKAAAAQALIDGGGGGPLCGIPIAVKDIFCTVSAPTTCGSRLLADYRSPYESHVTGLLDAAGAVRIGKCNMDEFAMGSTGENSSFGPTLNPWDPERSPGGSSSGSAVAVASGIVPAAIGTDTGGSVRMPASYCGISGMKPTYGFASRRGMVAYSSSMDQAGVFARSASDLRTVLEVITGSDPWDSTSIADGESIRSSVAARRDLEGTRIGIAEEFFAEGVEDAVARIVREAIAGLELLGAKTVPVAIPHLGHAVSAYYILACSEASSNLARFDGLLYGRRAEAAELDEMVMRSRSEGFGAEVRKRIMLGAFALSHGYVDAYYHQAQKVRQCLAADFEKAFADCDAIATPSAPTTAPLLGAFEGHAELMYLQDVCTVTANMCQLPAISVPCGLADGLPVGLQLLGPQRADGILLSVAESFQRETDHHEIAPPGRAQ